MDNGDIWIEGDTMKIIKNLIEKYDTIREAQNNEDGLLESFNVRFIIYDYLKDSKNFSYRNYYYKKWQENKKIIKSWYHGN